MARSFQLSTDHSKRPQPRSRPNLARFTSNTLPIPPPRWVCSTNQVFDIDSRAAEKTRKSVGVEGETHGLSVRKGDDRLGHGLRPKQRRAHVRIGGGNLIAEVAVLRQPADKAEHNGRVGLLRESDFRSLSRYFRRA